MLIDWLIDWLVFDANISDISALSPRTWKWKAKIEFTQYNFISLKKMAETALPTTLIVII
jgi:hypothetical protein